SGSRSDRHDVPRHGRAAVEIDAAENVAASVTAIECSRDSTTPPAVAEQNRLPVLFACPVRVSSLRALGCPYRWASRRHHRRPQASHVTAARDIVHRRRQLIDTARALFTTRPYDQVTTTEIAKSAGVAYGLIAHH